MVRVEVDTAQPLEIVEGKDVCPGDVVISLDPGTQGCPFIRVYNNKDVTFQSLGSESYYASLLGKFRRLRKGEVIRITN